MHERTIKLRALMDKHRLKCPAVARLLHRANGTVRIWRTENDSRVIPAEVLELLEFKLGSHK